MRAVIIVPLLFAHVSILTILFLPPFCVIRIRFVTALLTIDLPWGSFADLLLAHLALNLVSDTGHVTKIRAA